MEDEFSNEVIARCMYAIFYLGIWCPNKGVLLKQLYESHLSLQQSKPHSNAAARTKTKWHVSKLWPLGSLLWGKPTCTKIARLIIIS